MKKLSYFFFTKSIGLYLNFLSFFFPNKATQIAYSLFSQPRKGKLSLQKLPNILKEATFETLNFDKHYIQIYKWKGNEKTILLIHGWESNASRWKKMMPYLIKTGSTIIAIDAPAHGLSSQKEFNVPIYAEYINVVVQKYRPQYLIGHSIGGKACMYFQANFANSSIEKLVILGSPSDFKKILTKYISLLSLNSKIYRGLQDHYIENFKFNIEDFSVRLFASKINIKGLIVHDINDKIVSFEEGKKIAKNWKNAIFIETIGLGHGLHDTELYKKIGRFLFDNLAGN